MNTWARMLRECLHRQTDGSYWRHCGLPHGHDGEHSMLLTTQSETDVIELVMMLRDMDARLSTLEKNP